MVDSIENENPVALLIQAWPNKKIRNGDWLNINAFGHYVVAFGYDNKERRLFYYDPWDGKHKVISYDKLNDRWHDLRSKIVYNHFGIFFKN